MNPDTTQDVIVKTLDHPQIENAIQNAINLSKGVKAVLT
jgi:hypothetical protein